MNRTRKGFTLVELLIVIVVIGILSAMMMLSSNEAVTTARANNIASNLRNLKTAALALYTDNINEYDEKTNDAIGTGITDITDDVFKYLNKSSEIPEKYTTTKGTGYQAFIRSHQWYVVYNFGKTAMAGRTEIQQKLKGRAKALGLMQGDNNQVRSSLANAEVGKIEQVFLRVR